MRMRVGIAVAILLAGIAVVVLVAFGGDDDAEGGAGDAGSVLAWEEAPLVIAPADLPDDRVTYGTVRNASLNRLQASNADFVVRDAGGTKLSSTVQFLGTYAHGIYGAFTKPNPLPDDERQRLGFTVDLETGQTSPLTVSYRLADQSKLPVTLFYRDVPALELPSEG